ncbi:MAG: O-antigen polymerase [Halioglobus sp.]
MSSYDPFAYLLPLAILVILVVAIFTLSPKKHLPMKIFLGSWIIVLGLHFFVVSLDLMPLRSVSLSTNFAIIKAVIAVLIGYLSVGFFLRNYRISHSKHSEVLRLSSDLKANVFDLIILFYALIVLVWMWSTVNTILGHFGFYGLESFRDLRNQVNYRGSSWGAVMYFATFGMCASVFVIAKNGGRPPRQQIIGYLILLVVLITSFLSTQRTGSFMLLIAVTFCLASKGSIAIARLAKLIAILFIIFLTVGAILGKAGNLDMPFAQIVTTGFQTMMYYMLSPLSALDMVQNSTNILLEGQYTARSIISLFNFIGLSDVPLVDLIQPYVFVPAPTNVYTFVHAPYRDFGQLFPIYHFFLGILLGSIFTLRNSHFGFRVMQAFLFYPLIFSFFQDQFFTLTSQWLQIAVSLAFLSYIHSMFSKLVMTPTGRSHTWSVA